MKDSIFNTPSRLISLAAPLFLLAGGGGWLSPGLAKALNLLIFILAMYFLLRKPMREFFAARLASVREMLERAAREKNAATAKMAELDARINRLDEELNGIKAQTEKEAAAERARIEAETQRDIERLKQTAQREIESAKQVALADLRSFAAHQAVDLAEQLIRREIKLEDDARLIQRVGEELTKVS